MRAVQRNCKSKSKQILLHVAGIPRRGNVPPARGLFGLTTKFCEKKGTVPCLYTTIAKEVDWKE